jgi:hypothetical protein
MKNAALERFALEQLDATANNDEQHSFLFRTEGAISFSYCAFSFTEDLDFCGDVRGLDLPWEQARIDLVASSDVELTPEELSQWRHAKCRAISRGSDYHEPATAWVVPLQPGEIIEGYALFHCESQDPEEAPTLAGVFPTVEAAKDALRKRAEVADA